MVKTNITKLLQRSAKSVRPLKSNVSKVKIEMELIISAIIGLIVGIIASFMFWGYQLSVKPNVSIAPQIAITNDEETGKKIFRFKIVNNGKNQLINITLKAWVCGLLQVPGGNVSCGIEAFPINNSNTLTLSPRGKSDRPWGLTEETTFRSSPDFDVENMIKYHDRRIMVTLKATDSISGTSLVQQKVFSADDIRIGHFEFGPSKRIISREA